MWEHYKKTVLAVQILVLLVSGYLQMIAHTPWAGIFFVALFMEAAGLLGAWWGARLKRKVLGRTAQHLPLQK